MFQIQNILLVEDEDDFRNAIAEQFLITAKFQVTEAGSGKEALKCICDDLYKIIIVNLSLPDLDGRELCKLMRNQGVKCPIVMLVERDTDIDSILSLDYGANDYVKKPFKFSLLLARTQIQLRQFELLEDTHFPLGPYTFKPASKTLINGKKEKIRLTEKETDILKFLLGAKNAIVSRDVLLHEVWGYNAGVTTHTLETHIYRLRQKIEPDPAQVSLLVTEGGGYKIVV